MYELYIAGTDDEGNSYPAVHYMGIACLQSFADDYVARHPKVVHLIIDVALPIEGYSDANTLLHRR